MSLELSDSERRLIELVRSLYCAELTIIVEKGLLLRAEVMEKVRLDRPLKGQMSEAVDRSHKCVDMEHML